VLQVESNVQKKKFHATIVAAALKETQLGQKARLKKLRNALEEATSTTYCRKCAQESTLEHTDAPQYCQYQSVMALS